MNSMPPLFPLPNESLVRLMEAVLVVNEQPTLDAMLRQLVDLSRSLLHADYAAAELYSVADQMHDFVSSGVAPAVAEPIVRIADDPQSVGFPPHHPERNALLAVPLVAHGITVGRLDVIRKPDEPFSEQEQELAVRFAAHAAIALHNGRLLQTVQRDRWATVVQNGRLRKLSDELLAVPSFLDLKTTMSAICAIARRLVGVAYGAIVVLDNGHLESFVEDKTQDVFTLPLWLETLREVDLTMQIATHFPTAGFTDDTLFVPILAEDDYIGHFFLTGKADDDGFNNDDYGLVEILAAHTAVIIQNTHAYEEVSRLVITEERARIGMDLHDGVIQSIYAVGLILESARMSAPESVAESDHLLVKAIEELNGTIRDIRNFILDLRPHRFDGNLRQALARLVREFQANTMISVTVDIAAALSGALSADAALAVFLTTQESLANVARHARATEVMLSAQQVNGMVVLRITDNGRGFNMEMLSQTTVGHGLSNMRSRAEELRGQLEISSVVGQGTAVSLALPSLWP